MPCSPSGCSSCAAVVAPSSSLPRNNLIIGAAGLAAAAIAAAEWWRRSTKNSSNSGHESGPAGRAARLAAGFSSAHREEAEVAILLALRCGRAMRACDEGRGGGASAEWKDSDGIDPVTKTDQDNEALVVEGLSAAFPNYLVIGEEATAAAGGAIPPLSSETPTFIVDPIDGTQNFVHGAPLSAVSIGLCKEGKPCLGVVYDPHRDEVFVGVAGEGAFLNGSPIAVDASASSLPRALVTTDVGYERSPSGVGAMMGAFSALLLRRCQSLRILGSTVLSLAWVACGRANAFVIGAHNEGGKPWDYCAAYVIATEAGAVFHRIDNRSYGPDDPPPLSSNRYTTIKVGPFDIYSRSCVCAGNAQLGAELTEVLRGAFY